MDQTTTLRDLYAAHAGKVAHKWNLYLDVYERVLAPWRERPLTLVEVGVQNGGSLELWAKYFPNAMALVGCDVDERCRALRFDDPRVRLVIGAINSAASARAIEAHAPAFDIFIDDGSHVSPDIIAAFCNYFPLVRPGGLYIVEDLHCAYRHEWQGGIARPNAVAFFKMLVDAMHQGYWEGDTTMAALAAPFVPAKVNVARLADAVASISFHDSLCIVDKRTADGGGRLGGRVIVGHEAAVDATPLALRDEAAGAQNER